LITEAKKKKGGRGTSEQGAEGEGSNASSSKKKKSRLRGRRTIKGQSNEAEERSRRTSLSGQKKKGRAC
jgi:hypothetical protein